MANLYVIERLSLHNKVRFTSNNLTIELDYNLKNRNLPISYEQIIDDLIEFSPKFEETLLEIINTQRTLDFCSGQQFWADDIKRFLRR